MISNSSCVGISLYKVMTAYNDHGVNRPQQKLIASHYVDNIVYR